MKTVSKLSLVALAVVAVGCNEKVSPELQSGNATTPTSIPTAAPKEFYFSLKNTSDAASGYRLHKTGEGNATAPCEVRSSLELSNENFRGNPVANDISCFFEAEELSLFNSGFKFQIEASKNTCDYVSYRPFGFFNRIPGDSSAEYYQFTCGTQTVSQGHLQGIANSLGINTNNALSAQPACNQFLVSHSLIPTTERRFFEIPSDEDLCRFNYKDSNPLQCDIGEITINEINVSHTPETDAAPESITFMRSTRTIQCGGKISNCVSGPITTHGNDDATDIIIHHKTTAGSNFDQEFEYKGQTGTATNIRYANYRRDLASLYVEYGDGAGLPGSYKLAWADNTLNKIFSPAPMDYYSHNLMMDNVSPIVDPTVIHNSAKSSGRWYAKPLAADPFMGLQETVSPFYVLYCLDNAYDIKARIRLMVRDWDRVFPPTSPDLELLTDIHKGTAARQDNNFVEIGGDLDGISGYNDVPSWSERIPMVRSAGPFDPFSTVWAPSFGWFNSAYFPNIKE